METSRGMMEELEDYQQGFAETDSAIIRSDVHSGNHKKRRITYSKDFLIKCFRHPACAKKPPVVPWPKPNLECTTETPRLKSPFAPYPRKKEENGRKPPVEDNISLRPHSGNFSSGCAPNLSPAHFPSHSQYNRFSFQNQDEPPPPKSFFDSNRGIPKSNLRFNTTARPELGGEMRGGERNLRDRGGIRDTRNERGVGGGGSDNNNMMRGNRDSDHLRNRGGDSRDNNGRQHNNDRRLWGPDSEERERNDWTRRRSNHRDNNNHRDRHRGHDEMPDWFTGGPTSRHDTIELDGFNDDKRCDRSAKQGKVSESNHQSSSSGGGGGGATENKSGTISPSTNVKEEEMQSGEPNQMDLLLELIMDSENQSSGILPNGLFDVQEIEESQADITTPGSGSRFSRFFQREPTAKPPSTHYEANGETPEKEAKLESSGNGDKITILGGSSNSNGGSANPFQALFGSKSDGNSIEGKSEFIKGMESELRQILFRGNAKEEEEEVTQPKMEQQMFQQMFQTQPLQQQQQQQQQNYHHHHHVQQPQRTHSQQQHQHQPEKQPPQHEQQQQQNHDMNAFKKLLEDLVIKGQTTNQQTTEAQDVNILPRIMNTGPPGMAPVHFNQFGVNSSVQTRPLQPHNVMVGPSVSGPNHAPSPHNNPLARFVDQSREMNMLQNQKRSSTPVAFTPTSVMRKMTTSSEPGPQMKSGAASNIVKEPMSSYVEAMSARNHSPPIFSNLTNAPPPPPQSNNPLATFMLSQMGQQSHHHQHMQPSHGGMPNPGMYPQQRLPFPVMGPPPNMGGGIQVPFSQYMMYQPPLHQRK